VWEAQQEPADLSLFGKRLTAGYIPNLAIVDCTASDKPPSYYLEWMGEGINIITPNKKLGSGPLGQYQAVKKVQRESYIHFFYEVRGAYVIGGRWGAGGVVQGDMVAAAASRFTQALAAASRSTWLW
jgi:homoserine dehydrogenase